MNSHDDDFEFDYWAALADNDPAAFEDARRAVISSLIESAPSDSRRRLTGLQWQVDRVRERADNPLKACIDISGMMWDKVLGEDGLVERLEELAGQRAPRERAVRSATVLPLRRDIPRN
ncbi:MAG: DUF3135 domain-containing protein [Gammaproteobacteria bacterium]|nr:DUF3135 domain-containing protein [Gammaproteobacteria bacterium]